MGYTKSCYHEFLGSVILIDIFPLLLEVCITNIIIFSFNDQVFVPLSIRYKFVIIIIVIIQQRVREIEREKGEGGRQKQRQRQRQINKYTETDRQIDKQAHRLTD